MQVPQNPAVYGPQRTNGIWNTCFAHNPSGALLAAMNFYGESTTGEPEETVMRRYAVGAPPDLGSNAGLNSSGPVQLAGYRYDSYTPSRSQVSLVFKGPQGKRPPLSRRWCGRAATGSTSFRRAGCRPTRCSPI